MKGIVLSFGLPKRKRALPDFRYLFKRFGVTVLFGLLLLSGLTAGVVFAGQAEKSTLISLDFLFTTNLDARLSQSPFGTFCACFASDFLFVFSVYLLGIAAWGIPFIAALTAFKGFGTGITAGFLCRAHGISGAGFYLLVLLPGTFLFCCALIHFSCFAFALSKRTFTYSVGKNQPAVSPRQELAVYSSRFFSALILTFFASVLDTLLWTLFAGTCQF